MVTSLMSDPHYWLTTERLALSKFCPWCRKHTAHKETK